MLRALFTLLIGLPLLMPQGMCLCQIIAHDHEGELLSDRCAESHDQDTCAPGCPLPHDHAPCCPAIVSASGSKIGPSPRLVVGYSAEFACEIGAPPAVPETTSSCQAPPPHFADPPLFVTHCAFLI
jgi:hypothetical protein